MAKDIFPKLTEVQLLDMRVTCAVQWHSFGVENKYGLLFEQFLMMKKLKGLGAYPNAD